MKCEILKEQLRSGFYNVFPVICWLKESTHQRQYTFFFKFENWPWLNVLRLPHETGFVPNSDEILFSPFGIALHGSPGDILELTRGQSSTEAL